MTAEQKIMADNLKKTFELIELSKNLSLAKIMKEKNINKKEAEIVFWKEVRRIKNITSGITDSDS